MSVIPAIPQRTLSSTRQQHLDDHNDLHEHTHNEFEPVNEASRVLAYVQSTNLNQDIVAGVDLTGLTTPVSVTETGRLIRITGHVRIAAGTAAANSAALLIREDANNLGAMNHGFAVSASAEDFLAVAIVVSPSVGVHTYKLHGVRTQGGGSMTASSTAPIPAYILVEDIGPVP